jgi:hypothetical protein
MPLNTRMRAYVKGTATEAAVRPFARTIVALVLTHGGLQ